MRLSQEPRYPRLPLSSFSLEFLHLRDSTFPYPLSKSFTSRPRYPRLCVFSPSVSSIVSPSHSYSHSGSPLSEYSHFSRLNQNPPSIACRTNSEFLTHGERTTALRPGQVQATDPTLVLIQVHPARGRHNHFHCSNVLGPSSLLQSPTRISLSAANQDIDSTPDCIRLISASANQEFVINPTRLQSAFCVPRYLLPWVKIPPARMQMLGIRKVFLLETSLGRRSRP
ncbi:hypothetical protein B0H13DRAFT_2313745 [Mycena leptocephala]|nr:hypothetical protein B0H13DRAFT_2313745 [Mycena leptocephala]